MLWVRATLLWVPVAVAVTALSLTLAVALQQAVRTGANDPQVEMIEDAATRLDAGAPPAAVIPAGSVEISASLAPWLLVYDRSGHLLAGSATLHGQPPPFPDSVLFGLRGQGRDLITWQPEAGVRSAVAAAAWRGGYLVAGRSLRREEERIGALQRIVLAGWLAGMTLTALSCLAAAALNRPGGPRPASAAG